MIHCITVRNVNEAFVEGFIHLRTEGIEEPSRNGPVLVAPGPVVTTYTNPEERVLFNPVRDANPVFHLMEAIWMLAGQHHVEWLLQFNKRFADYAEPNGVQHGAYGYRWATHFGMDQIYNAIVELRQNRESRRVVIGMWDPIADQLAPVRDVPCNTHIYLDCRGGKLNMSVCNRSNDMLWGAYGANVVHMSMLMELIARAVGIPIGEYRQFSNNFHVYTEGYQVQHFLRVPPSYEFDFYSQNLCHPWPLFQSGETWEDFTSDCEQLVSGSYLYATQFFELVARPLYDAYLLRKKGLDISKNIEQMPQSNDWVLAFKQWVDRRSET